MSKEYFDKTASSWDEMRRGFFSESVRESAFREAKLDNGVTAADIGCGTGFITEGLIKYGVRIIAVDQSEVMLEKMKKKFEGEKNIEYRIGTAENLPVGDEEVDVLFANMYLHHTESPLDSIREMVRILKPGGKLVITDLDKHSFQFLRDEQHDKWLGFQRGKISDWFVTSGLRDIKVRGLGEECCSQCETTGENAKIGIFIAMGSKPL